MDIIFKGQHVAVPDRMKAHARERIDRLDRVIGTDSEVVVELRKEQTKSAEERYIAQVTLKERGTILRSEERGPGMELAIDAAMETLARQVRRFKQRQHHRRHISLARSVGSEPAEAAASEAGSELPTIPSGAAPSADEEDELHFGQVVRVKRFAVKPMSVEEAIDQADLLGHEFYLFFNTEEDQYSLLYHRKDGGYGLIVPEPL